MFIINKAGGMLIGAETQSAMEQIYGWVATQKVPAGGRAWTKCTKDAAKECDAFAKTLVKTALLATALTWFIPFLFGSLTAVIGLVTLGTAVAVYDMQEIIQHFADNKDALPINLDAPEARAAWIAKTTFVWRLFSSICSTVKSAVTLKEENHPSTTTARGRAVN